MVRNEGFEIPNSGCDEDELPDAGPGVMGRILITLSYIKEKTHSPRSGSTPRTPSAVDDESKPLALTDTPHSAKEGKIEGSKDIPQSLDLKESRFDDFQKEHWSDQEHHEALGDGRESSPGGASTESSRFSQFSDSPRGNSRSASPSIPSDFGERIISLLPGSHANPYAVSGTTESSHSSIPPSPSTHRSAPSSPGILSRLKTERLMSKLADRLHFHDRGSSPRVAAESPGSSPRVASESTGSSPRVASESTGSSPRVATESTGSSPRVATESTGSSPRVATKSSGTPTAKESTRTPISSLPLTATPPPTREPPPPPTPVIATALGPTEN